MDLNLSLVLRVSCLFHLLGVKQLKKTGFPGNEVG